MKWMNVFLVLAVGMAIGLGSAGCGGGDDDGGGSGIEGSWKAESFNGSAMPDNVSLVLTFRDNGTLETISTVNGVVEKETGTWSEAGGVLTVVSADRSVDRVPYSVSGNTLTMSDPEGVFVMKRR